MGTAKISPLAAIRQGAPSPPAEMHAGLPRELEKIIQRCLRKDPAWRYQSAADLKISLYDLQRDGESDEPAPVAAPRRRSWLWVGALALGLAAGASGARWHPWPPGAPSI